MSFLFRQRKKRASASTAIPEEIMTDIPEADEDTTDVPMEDDLPRHSTGQVPGGISYIDSDGVVTRRRGKATSQVIRDLPPGTRVIIEINNEGQPCNMPASTLLTSYLGVIAKDCTMAPISFSDWRNPAMEIFKKRMVEEIEVKFAFPPQTQVWVRQALGNKWRAYKTSLKKKYWNPDKPIEEIIAHVPDGVDHVQWATLVTRWNDPQEKERSEQNILNASKLKCPHTMGRKSSVTRQQEMETTDRLQLWRINRLHKDGSWVSQEAKEKWDLVCALLASKNLTPEDGNIEENEAVFADVLGPEHPGRVRCKGFGVTPSKYYPGQASTSSTGASHMDTASDERYDKLESEVSGIKSYMTKMDTKLDKLYRFMKRSGKKKKNEHVPRPPHPSSQ